MSDNASEFRSAEFETAVERLGARHLFIRAGRPQTNGVVERVQERSSKRLEAGLRSLPDPQIHRAPAGPGPVPDLTTTPTGPTPDAGRRAGLPKR
jgi:transposase InsO family protein